MGYGPVSSDNQTPTAPAGQSSFGAMAPQMPGPRQFFAKRYGLNHTTLGGFPTVPGGVTRGVSSAATGPSAGPARLQAAQAAPHQPMPSLPANGGVNAGVYNGPNAVQAARGYSGPPPQSNTYNPSQSVLSAYNQPQQHQYSGPADAPPGMFTGLNAQQQARSSAYTMQQPAMQQPGGPGPIPAGQPGGPPVDGYGNAADVSGMGTNGPRPAGNGIGGTVTPGQQSNIDSMNAAKAASATTRPV